MENEDNIYYGKDGRLRVYVKETKKTISYPKYLMQKELGRELLSTEHVHHIDENPLNNDISNLRVMSNRDHARSHQTIYQDKIAICGWCGKEFTWTGLQQQRFYSERRTGRHKSDSPFCSRECSGKYGRQLQLYKSEGHHDPKRKLTEDQVKYVRENYIPYDKNFGSRALGRQFNVDRTVINYIVKGKTYKEIL